MEQAFKDLAMEIGLETCWKSLEPHEEVAMGALQQYIQYGKARNDPSLSEAVVQQEQKYFTDQCYDNACYDSYRWLFNALATNDPLSPVTCNMLDMIVKASQIDSRIECSTYINDKGSHLLYEGLIAMIMETSNLIIGGMSPADAVQVTINEGAQWATDASQSITTHLRQCPTMAEPQDSPVDKDQVFLQ